MRKIIPKYLDNQELTNKIIAAAIEVPLPLDRVSWNLFTSKPFAESRIQWVLLIKDKTRWNLLPEKEMQNWMTLL